MSQDLTKILNIRPEIAYFGSVQDREGIKNFGMYEDDRRRHMYVLGKTGMGKSTLLTNMILQDIHNGHGVCFLDPHGETVEYVLQRIPEHRIKDVVYFNPADTEHPIGFNIFESVNDEQMFLLAAGMMSVFQRIWEGAWSARMEYILNNTLLALLETPGNTLLDVVRMLTDDVFRQRVIKDIIDPVVKNFWIKEFASFNDKYRTEAIAPILNKIGQFFSIGLIRNILGQEKSTINIRSIMDEGKILLINLSKGRLGDDNSAILGSLMITRIQLAAMSRVDMPENERRDFYMYVDEFQNFITDTFAVILSEARKYRLSLILAHQYIAQLVESDNQKVKNAIFGNVGTMLAFRVGAEDGEALEKEFAPIFTFRDLTKLNKAQVALKMTIGGRSTNAFLASTLPPIYPLETGCEAAVVAASRERYTRPLAEVAKKIRDRLEPEINPEDNERQIKKKRAATIAYSKTRDDIVRERRENPPEQQSYAPRPPPPAPISKPPTPPQQPTAILQRQPSPAPAPQPRPVPTSDPAAQLEQQIRRNSHQGFVERRNNNGQNNSQPGFQRRRTDARYSTAPTQRPSQQPVASPQTPQTPKLPSKLDSLKAKLSK
jgi:hypothetical protein